MLADFLFTFTAYTYTIPWQRGLAFFLLCLVALAASIYLSVALILWIWRIRWKPQVVDTPIEFENNGNVPCVLQIGAVSPDQKIKFKYFIGGAALPVEPFTDPTPPRTAKPRPAAQPQPKPAAQAQPQSQVVAAAPVQAGAEKPALNVGEKASNAKAGAKKTIGIIILFADILGTLGSLIPGDVGKSFAAQAKKIKAARTAAMDKLTVPMQKMNQAQLLETQVNQLQDKSGVKPPPITGGRPSVPYTPDPETPVVLVPQTASAAAGSADAPAQEPKAVSVPAFTPDRLFTSCVNLPVIKPAEKLNLLLRIEPENQYRSGEFTYWFFTRQLELAGFSPADPLKLTKNSQTIIFNRASPLYRLLTVALAALVLAINGLWLVLFIITLLQLLP
jgi:hypothetical protein